MRKCPPFVNLIPDIDVLERMDGTVTALSIVKLFIKIQSSRDTLETVIYYLVNCCCVRARPDLEPRPTSVQVRRLSQTSISTPPGGRHGYPNTLKNK